MKIGIVGAGPGGLAAARHCLEGGLECTVFEQTGKVGGTWNYTENTGLDENGLPVHSSMYEGLRTNLPKELMEYKNFSYQIKNRCYITQKEVLNYIESFAKNFKLEQHIKFSSHVLEVDILPSRKWKVKVRNLAKNTIEEYTFDGMILCNGHHSQFALPEVEGLEKFEGTCIHSHVYRRPDAYKNKRVLVLGNGPSAQDISRIVAELADKVFVSYRCANDVKYPANIELKPWVAKMNAKSVQFLDNTTEEIDDIIFCTGYRYNFPFLTPQCGIRVENNTVKPLYKHLININNPTMAILGVPFCNCPFVIYGLQINFFLELLKGNLKVTKKEMEDDLCRDTLERKEQDYPPHYAHKLGKDQGVYFDDLATMAKIEKIPPVYQKLFLRVLDNKDFNDVFKIISDDEFIEVA